MKGAVKKACPESFRRVPQLRSRPVVVLTYSVYAPRVKPTPPKWLRRPGGPAALLDGLFEQPLLPTFKVIRQWSQV